MTPHDKIQLLQGLLARVRKNSQLSRVRSAAVILAETAPAEAPDSDDVEAVADDDWSDVDSIPPSAAAPEALSELDIELLDEDIIEITEEELPAVVADVAESAAAAAADEVLEAELDEAEAQEVPASSRRPRVAAASMDEALASAAQQMREGGTEEAEEREVPLKTPPPESGRQVAGPPAAELAAPRRPELDEPQQGAAAAAARPAQVAPTPEQLGQTIELEEAEGPELELARPAEPPPKSAPADELEAALPKSEAPGGYDQALVPPPEAREELARRRERDGVAVAEQPSVETSVEPEITARPPLDAAAGVATLSGEAQSFQPKTFLELLDASLEL